MRTRNSLVIIEIQCGPEILIQNEDFSSPRLSNISHLICSRSLDFPLSCLPLLPSQFDSWSHHALPYYLHCISSWKKRNSLLIVCVKLSYILEYCTSHARTMNSKINYIRSLYEFCSLDNLYCVVTGSVGTQKWIDHKLCNLAHNQTLLVDGRMITWIIRIAISDACND